MRHPPRYSPRGLCPIVAHSGRVPIFAMAVPERAPPQDASPLHSYPSLLSPWAHPRGRSPHQKKHLAKALPLSGTRCVNRFPSLLSNTFFVGEDRMNCQYLQMSVSFSAPNLLDVETLECRGVFTSLCSFASILPPTFVVLRASLFGPISNISRSNSVTAIGLTSSTEGTSRTSLWLGNTPGWEALIAGAYGSNELSSSRVCFILRCSATGGFFGRHNSHQSACPKGRRAGRF